jgi:hypothetical protein
MLDVGLKDRRINRPSFNRDLPKLHQTICSPHCINTNRKHVGRILYLKSGMREQDPHISSYLCGWRNAVTSVFSTRRDQTRRPDFVFEIRHERARSAHKLLSVRMAKRGYECLFNPTGLFRICPIREAMAGSPTSQG